MKIRVRKAPERELKAKPDEKALGFGQYFTDHMFVMLYEEGKGWHDAVIKKYRNFSFDPAAMVLHYGQAIFEGLKAYHGKDDHIFLFRPYSNLERMNKSAKRMCMPEFPVETVFEGLKKLLLIEKEWIPKAKGASLYIRPTMVATEAALGVKPAKKYMFFIILSPVNAYYSEGFSPVKIFVTDKYVRAVPGGVGNVKTAGNYAASLKAAKEAKEQGYTQVLWLDAADHKYVEEVGTMNIFFLIGDALITPPLTGSILDGITRKSVIRLTKDWGLNVREQRITIHEVFNAADNGTLKEVFGTGTAAVISPVGALRYGEKEYTINGKHTGKLAKRLFDTIQNIQYGYREDPYDWVIKVC